MAWSSFPYITLTFQQKEIISFLPCFDLPLFWLCSWCVWASYGPFVSEHHRSFEPILVGSLLRKICGLFSFSKYPLSSPLISFPFKWVQLPYHPSRTSITPTHDPLMYLLPGETDMKRTKGPLFFYEPTMWFNSCPLISILIICKLWFDSQPVARPLLLCLRVFKNMLSKTGVE